MHNVPKTVQARLRQAPATTDQHPDADLLTAFAERSLAARERDHVLEHLAQCGDCREVVALALPPTEAVALLNSGSTARIGWLSWPVLRWGVVAAGILAVTSIGILQYKQRHQEKTLVATGVTAYDRSPESSARSSTSADQPAPRPNGIVAQPEPMHRATSMGTFHAAPAGLESGAGGGHVSVAPRRALAPAATTKQNPTPPSTAVEASGATPLAAAPAAAQNETQTPAPAEDQLAKNEQELSQDSADRVARAKSAAEQPSPVMLPAPLLRTDPTLMGVAMLRWTINANGSLQRSVDGGKTWLNVNVIADNSMTSKLAPGLQTTTVKVQAEPTTQASTQMKKDANIEGKSSEAEPPAHTIFRAVAVSSNAAEVWAGGSGGALYHTIDAGNRWVRVVPSDTGVRLTGDIIGIRFSDPRDGTVTTSNVEIWTTTDAGQTWHKQQ
jgi:Photosynthesis system II assembly factor YCF48/Putative zinc-finger